MMHTANLLLCTWLVACSSTTVSTADTSATPQPSAAATMLAADAGARPAALEAGVAGAVSAATGSALAGSSGGMGVAGSAGVGVSEAGRRAAAGGDAAAVSGRDGRDGRAGTGGVGGVAESVTAAGSGGMLAQPNTGVLPVVMDLEKPGPFSPVIVNGTGPGSGYRMDHPKELGRDGTKHPVLIFVAGGGFPENYSTLLQHVASHGFVVLTYAATDDQGKQVLEGIDWLGMQAAAQSGMLAGKLDLTHVAAAGHSFGSLAVFNAASDPRLTTTLHLQGGTLDPHKEVANLRAPAAFICGETPTGDQDGTWSGDMANPNCAIDFERATVPVFYGSLKGAAHIQLTDAVSDTKDALRLRMLGSIVGWLRWRLAGDASQRERFVGPDCALCKPDSGWVVKQKGAL